MSRTTRFAAGAAALVAAGVALTTGATASNTVPNSVAGFGTSTVSGATVSNIVYTVNGTGTTVTQVVLTFSADQSGKTVLLGFNGGTQTTCTVSTTTGTCSSLSQSVASLTSLEVTVHQ